MLHIKADSLNKTNSAIHIQPTETLPAMEFETTTPIAAPNSIATIFQNRTILESPHLITIQDVLDGVKNVATAQEPINPANVKKLVTSIVKDKQLWQHITLAECNGVYYTVSGRHRATALQEIVDNYGLSAENKLVKRTPENETFLTSIDPHMEVVLIKVLAPSDVAHLQVTANGSRSMTSAEQLVTKSWHTKLSPKEAIKMQLGRKLHEQLGVSFQTGVSMVSKMSTAIKTLAYADDSQCDEIVAYFQSYMAGNSEGVPSNMARDYGVLVEMVLSQEIEVENDEGVDVSMSLAEYFSNTIEKPVKKTRSAKADKAAETIAKLTAMLQAQGIDLGDLDI